MLTQLLGYPHVKNYDSSWTEWGSLVGVPIETGDSAAWLRATSRYSTSKCREDDHGRGTGERSDGRAVLALAQR